MSTIQHTSTVRCGDNWSRTFPLKSIESIGRDRHVLYVFQVTDRAEMVFDDHQSAVEAEGILKHDLGEYLANTHE